METLENQLEFNALVAEVPDSSAEAKQTRKERARAFAKLRREQKAAEVEERKELVKLLIQLGLSHHHYGDYQESLSPLLRAIELDPSKSNARELLVMSYVQLEEYDQAKDHLIDVLRCNPEEAWAYVALAACYAAGDSNTKQAEQFLNRALEIDPDHIQAHNHLGALQLEAERFDEALGHFNQAIACHSDDPYAHYGRVMAHLGQRSLNEAESALELFAQEIIPETPEVAQLIKDARAALLFCKEKEYY